MSSSVLSLAAFLALAAECAPSVAPGTLADIARTESAFSTLAINVNGRDGGPVRARSRDEAVVMVRALMAAGRDFDAGLGQINVRNWGWLGLTAETVFDPCANVAASAKVLTAFSGYNTGNSRRGFENGYVRKVVAARSANARAVAAGAYAVPAAQPVAPPPAQEAWDVWARPAVPIPDPAADEPDAPSAGGTPSRVVAELVDD